MTSSFEDVYRIQTARIMELERELAAAKKKIKEMTKVAGIYARRIMDFEDRAEAAEAKLAAIEKERGEK